MFSMCLAGFGSLVLVYIYCIFNYIACEIGLLFTFVRVRSSSVLTFIINNIWQICMAEQEVRAVPSLATLGRRSAGTSLRGDRPRTHVRHDPG